MNPRHSFLLALLSLLVLPVFASAQCVWGSFDGSRINYAIGPLNGDAHSNLRTIITTNGGSVAPGTPTLTDAYLSTVDVFYTSLLSNANGALSPAEQTSLQNWVAGGGTLIVTADNIPGAYETFTSAYGVSNYTLVGNINANGTVVAAHPITSGITTFRYSLEVTFTYGADAMLLGVGATNVDYMIVMEPATGFLAGGRILVTGDHNMFTNSYIGFEDNVALANNVVTWACQQPVSVESASWGSIKALYR